MKQKEKGQSIIEVVITVGIVALVLVAIVSAVTVSVRNSTFSKNKSLATKYVNEGLEAVRSIRDASWSNFAQSGSYGLDDSGGVWSYSGSADTPAPGFTRQVSVSCGAVDSCNVMVGVTWNFGSKIYNSEASTTYTRWSP